MHGTRDDDPLYAVGPESVRAAFANQVAYCLTNGAPLTARIVAAQAALIDDPAHHSATIDAIRGWTGAPLADALPLRATGGFHSLYRAGEAPALAAIYAGEPLGPADDAARLAATLADQDAVVHRWLDSAPQTNEVGRSANYIAGLLALADLGVPPRFELVEIGSSAGLNLMLDHYAYDLGGVRVGPLDPAISITPDWRGAPPPDRPITIERATGCDIAPIDLSDPVAARRLTGYVWPDQVERFARVEAAIAVAQAHPPQVARMAAADFVDQELARPQAGGTTRVLVHSIVWQYLPAEEQARITAAMERHGAAATSDRPLAWLALEANRTVHRHELTLRLWPDAVAPRMLATSHPHGTWIAWGE